MKEPNSVCMFCIRREHHPETMVLDDNPLSLAMYFQEHPDGELMEGLPV